MRERLSFDRHWRFALGHAANAALDFEFARDRSLVKAGEARGAASPGFDDAKWKQIDVPHDWAIELAFDPRDADREMVEHGFRTLGPDYPQYSVGWYRRVFDVPNSDLGRRVCVEFDGVFRDCVVWVNGFRLGRHEDGYTSFRYDLTDMLHYGARNVIAVRADVTQWEGWWYEGAGIYRHVWLVKTDPVHVAPNGVQVVSDVEKSGGATVTITTTIANDGRDAREFTLSSDVRGPDGGSAAGVASRSTRLPAGGTVELVQKVKVRAPQLWSCEEPNLYSVRSIVSVEAAVDEVETPFGIRTLRWDAAEGFFLNDKPVKIKGTCNHQHHAGLGIALPDKVYELRLDKLQAMGSNAYRCSHYMATAELLDMCDRRGILVMAENRLAGSSPEVIGQFREQILRDRNHPSIILWSLANEEHTVQWATAGERIGRTMVDLAHALDPTRMVTTAMHDRGLGEGFANVVDVHGWNYIHVGDIEAFHKRRPQQPIVGSEEGSTVCTRGVYADDKSRGYVSAYDLRAPKWGSTAEVWWTYFAERPWIAGGFVWTGFDYYGEPIPYKWPCTASHFGLMDLCGFPKDLYYYFKAWWGGETVLHLFPHWNWVGKEGRPIDVRAFSNCDEVELLHNGKSLGRKAVKRNGHVAWQVLYEPGAIETRGYIGGEKVAEAKRETTGAPARVVATADRSRLAADGEDVAEIAVHVVDDAGRAVPTADNLIHFDVSGEGRLIGVGNGDPSSHESDKAPYRRLFNGLAMGLIQSTTKAGATQVRVYAEGLGEAIVTLKTTRAAGRPSVGEAKFALPGKQEKYE